MAMGLRPPARAPGGRPVFGGYHPQGPPLFHPGGGRFDSGGPQEQMGGGSGHVPVGGGAGHFQPYPGHGGAFHPYPGGIRPGGGRPPFGGGQFGGGGRPPFGHFPPNGGAGGLESGGPPFHPYPGGDPSGPPIHLGGGQFGNDPWESLQQLLQGGQAQNPFVQHLLQGAGQPHPVDQMLQGENVSPQQLNLLRDLFNSRQMQGMV